MLLLLTRWWRCATHLILLVGIGVALGIPPAVADDFQQRQWHLDAMSARELWTVATGKGVTVAVVDSGVDPVTELRGRVVGSKNFAGEPPPDGGDGNGHGTLMASLISGTGASGGVQGLAPGASIISLQTGYRNHSVFDFSVKTWIRSIKYAADHGARIINFSQGVSDLSSSEQQSLHEAVAYALSKGLLIFAATGNSAKEGNVAGYPASSPGVVGVAAVDRAGKVARFSNFGPQVKLAAPGVDIPARCDNGQGLCRSEGTSAATALASASAALIWSKHPTWTNNQVLRVMMQTASKPKGKVPSQYIGYGIIRPGQVLIDGKGDPGEPDVNPLMPREAEKGKEEKPAERPTPVATAPSGEATRRAESEDAHRAVDGLASSGSGDGGSGFLWPALGMGGGVVVLGAVVFFVRRRPQSSA
ncbi:S8 family serine peptidase [Streptomyces sp. 796.1]|uniref:S8 family serine peptidase n=1 Tax=Streptomyces sp. 796.1 TaxID=3163029 RepID=UPI0039C9504D